jgi:hypothetical protein
MATPKVTDVPKIPAYHGECVLHILKKTHILLVELLAHLVFYLQGTNCTC